MPKVIHIIHCQDVRKLYNDIKQYKDIHITVSINIKIVWDNISKQNAAYFRNAIGEEYK